jgi:hypothetical protein
LQHRPGDDRDRASVTNGRVTRPADGRRFWRTELVALAAGLVGSTGLIVLAITSPFYTSSVSEQISSGAVIDHPSTSATLNHGPVRRRDQVASRKACE